MYNWWDVKFLSQLLGVKYLKINIGCYASKKINHWLHTNQWHLKLFMNINLETYGAFRMFMDL